MICASYLGTCAGINAYYICERASYQKCIIFKLIFYLVIYIKKIKIKYFNKKFKIFKKQYKNYLKNKKNFIKKSITLIPELLF